MFLRNITFTVCSTGKNRFLDNFLANFDRLWFTFFDCFLVELVKNTDLELAARYPGLQQLKLALI